MISASSRLRQRPALKSSGALNSRARRQRNQISYNEDSEDSDDFDVAMSQDDYEAPQSAIRPRRAQAQPATPIRTSPRIWQNRKRKAPATSRKNTIVGVKRQRNTSSQKKYGNQEIGQNPIQMTGKMMPWTTLPYHVLASIFAYASYPLASVAHDPSPSITWLVRMALMCKAFTEPALSALYFEPPIYASRQIYSLMSTLQNQNQQSSINYRGKIKYLSMGSMKGSHSIESIIPLAPQLRGIALGVHSDDPKLCMLHTIPSTSHARNNMSIFFTLDTARTQLKSWTWNRTLASHCLSLASVKEVHQSTPFQSLSSLTFIDFHMPETVEYNGKETRGEEALADTLSALPSLRKLQFSLADVVNERVMSLLPDNLQVLVLTSCYNLFSPALEGFLLAKGQNIRELVLSHNQSLNLSFLANLSRACPKLETLKMNLLYYNSHTTFNDSTPRYDNLLGEGEQPTWPASLCRLELFQLRRWKTAAAELFFSSFVDTPGSLPNLRHMEIKASIDESGWRDRIAFRDKWVLRLHEVFMRKSFPPNPHLKSFASYKSWKAEQAKQTRPDKLVMHTRSAERKESSATEISAAQATQPLAVSSDSNSDVPLAKVRRSARVKPEKQGAYNDSDSSESKAISSRRRRRPRDTNNSSSEDSALEDDGTGMNTERTRKVSEESAYVQGLCDVVDVVIDNLRPTEEQLHESDFLDEERSGDEDWNGDDDMDDGRYAW